MGHSKSLVELMAGHLRRLGVSVTTLTQPGRDMAERINTMTHKDTVLAFAFRQMPRGLLPLLNVAKDTGAGSILISDHLGASARPKPDCLMMASRGDHEDEAKTLLVPMAISKALVLSITHVKGKPSIESLDRCNELIKIFENS